MLIAFILISHSAIAQTSAKNSVFYFGLGLGSGYGGYKIEPEFVTLNENLEYFDNVLIPAAFKVSTGPVINEYLHVGPMFSFIRQSGSIDEGNSVTVYGIQQMNNLGLLATVFPMKQDFGFFYQIGLSYSNYIIRVEADNGSDEVAAEANAHGAGITIGNGYDVRLASSFYFRINADVVVHKYFRGDNNYPKYAGYGAIYLSTYFY